MSLAQDSGGFIMRDTDELSVGLKRIAREMSAYYLIGYTSANVDRDGSFRTIEVRVPDRQGLEVRARKGYYAARADEESDDGPDAASRRPWTHPTRWATSACG